MNIEHLQFGTRNCFFFELSNEQPTLLMGSVGLTDEYSRYDNGIRVSWNENSCLWDMLFSSH